MMILQFLILQFLNCRVIILTHESIMQPHLLPSAVLSINRSYPCIQSPSVRDDIPIAMAHSMADLTIWGLETYWSARAREGSRLTQLVLDHFLKGWAASLLFSAALSDLDSGLGFANLLRTAPCFFLRLRITNHIIEPATSFSVSTANGEDRSGYRRYST